MKRILLTTIILGLVISGAYAQTTSSDSDASTSSGAGTNSVFLDTNAGLNITSQNSSNVFLGYRAGQYVQDNTGDANVFIGYLAGSRTQGTQNVFIGHVTGGVDNTGNKTGVDYNTIIGSQAGKYLESGASNNSLFGQAAGFKLSDGDNNTVGGKSAGYYLATGSNNTFFGSYAGKGTSSGSGDNNSAFGYNSGLKLTVGEANTLIGQSAGAAVTSGNHNTAIGSAARDALTSGDFNVLLGTNAGGSLLSTGSRNVFIGNGAGYAESGSDRLYIDNSSTSTPLIYGDFSADELTFNANVGIGTSTPSSKLEVAGNIKINSGTSGTSSKIIFKTADNGDLSKYIGTESYWTVIGVHGNEGLKIKDNSGDILMQINGKGNNNGNVGIGTTTTGTHKLAVEGTIGAREIKVETTIWPDFVFETDYDLRPLSEVESYILENKHLPEIPSEAEVLKNGIQLGEINAKLLQKIEELTLYLIEQNKTIEKLQEQNKALEKLQTQVDQLTSHIKAKTKLP